MESMRDVNRVMEREIKKGSSPLKLDHIEFGDYSYQEIMSQEKLFEVLTYLLRIGDFKQYAGKTILNNVYMDLRWKKPVFKRTKTIMERNNIFATIRRYVKKLKPQYNGDVYLEKLTEEFPDGKVDMGKLSKEYDTLEQEHETTYAEFKTVREDLQRLWKVKSNIDTAVRFNQRTAEQKLQNQPQIRHKKEDMTR